MKKNLLGVLIALFVVPVVIYAAGSSRQNKSETLPSSSSSLPTNYSFTAASENVGEGSGDDADTVNDPDPEAGDEDNDIPNPEGKP